MTLDEMVKCEDDSTIIHIGSATAYFFVGTKAEYEADIDEIAERCYSNRKRFYVIHKNKYEYLLDNLPQLEDDVELYCKGLIKYANEMRTHYRLMNKCKEYIDTFKPLRSRRIKERYERLEDDGVVIIVSGLEQGRCWSRNEYLKMRARRNFVFDEEEEE